MIYFLQARLPDRPGPIKIGYTASDAIWERVNNLQTGCPWELVVLRVTAGTHDDEKALHREFKHLRMRREWFEFTPELLEFAMACPPVIGLDFVPPPLERPTSAPVVDLAARRSSR